MNTYSYSYQNINEPIGTVTAETSTEAKAKISQIKQLQLSQVDELFVIKKQEKPDVRFQSHIRK